MNIRSIPCNLNKLVQFLSYLDTRFDIIGLTETWLNESNKNFYNFWGYTHAPLVRPDRIHGGISLYISTDLFYKVIPEISMTNRDIECLLVEVDLNGRKVNVGALYRTPNADVHKFTEHVS